MEGEGGGYLGVSRELLNAYDVEFFLGTTIMAGYLARSIDEAKLSYTFGFASAGLLIATGVSFIDRYVSPLLHVRNRDREGGAFVEFASDVDVGVEEAREFHGDVEA